MSTKSQTTGVVLRALNFVAGLSQVAALFLESFGFGWLARILGAIGITLPVIEIAIEVATSDFVRGILKKIAAFFKKSES